MFSAALLKQASPLIVAAALLLALSLIAWRTVAVVDGMVADARAQAVRERDAHWSAEIEKANAAAAALAADQIREALAVEAAANDRVREVEFKLTELETQNAALPNAGACGLGRDRVRLLNR